MVVAAGRLKLRFRRWSMLVLALAEVCLWLPGASSFSATTLSGLIQIGVGERVSVRKELKTNKGNRPSNANLMLKATLKEGEPQQNLHGTVAHATRLRNRGLTVLAEPIVDSPLIREAHDKVMLRLAGLLEDVEAAGFDPIEQQCEFYEIATRQRNRWDLQLQVPGQVEPDKGSTWQQLCSAALEAATPIIREAQGSAYTGAEPLMIGAVISRPGTNVQRFHCDADLEHLAAAKADPSHRLYNLFIPLVDVVEHGDGTEFWGAPQTDGNQDELSRHFLSDGCHHSGDTLKLDQVESPACRAGGLIIYDYRTIHRGLPNPAEGGRERPVAYVILATGGAGEGYNFPDKSVKDEVDPQYVARYPFFRDLHIRGELFLLCSVR